MLLFQFNSSFSRSLGILDLMRKENDSKVTEFVLLGLSSSWELQLFLFLIFVLLYMVIVLGNVLIMLTVWTELTCSNCLCTFFWATCPSLTYA